MNPSNVEAATFAFGNSLRAAANVHDRILMSTAGARILM